MDITYEVLGSIEFDVYNTLDGDEVVNVVPHMENVQKAINIMAM